MKRLILVGGGHAHLHVLKSLTRRRRPDVEIVLISPYCRQIYSGMVPGWMAGHYRLEQCAAGLEPLAQAAGVRFLKDSVVAMDAARQVVVCAHAGEIGYDLLSLDTGATVDVSGLETTCGVQLLPIRPLEHFVVSWSRQLEIFRQTGHAELAVVGGGAAGVELALAARYRLVHELGADRTSVCQIVGSGLLAGHSQRVVERVRQALAKAGIVVRHGHATGSAAGLQLESGEMIAADAVIAAPGVCPAAWLKDSGLALAGDGFIAVGDGQQSISHPQVFAAGDVASRVDAPHAKSGVYAVRAGPVVTANLMRALDGLSPLCYRPQRRSLYLLATGPQEAIVSWGNWSSSGHWAWQWKDWIDRRFMKQYELKSALRRG